MNKLKGIMKEENKLFNERAGLERILLHLEDCEEFEIVGRYGVEKIVMKIEQGAKFGEICRGIGKADVMVKLEKVNEKLGDRAKMMMSKAMLMKELKLLYLLCLETFKF